MPSQADALAFNGRIGPIALLHDLRRYVMRGLIQLTSIGHADADATHAAPALASLDSRQQELAACQLMNGDIELLLQNVVVSMLKDKFGADGLDWYDSGVPERVQDRVEEKWEQGGTLSPERCFDLLHYKTIMKENWDLFKVLFVEQDDPKPRVNNSLRWIGALNHQARLDLAHASRRGLDWIDTDAGKKAVADLREWLALAKKLKVRCDSFLSGRRGHGSQGS